MDPVYLLRFFLFSQLVLLLLAGVGIGKQGKCSSSFSCGILGTLYFPFTTIDHPDCGLLTIQGCDDPSSSKMIQLGKDGRFLEVVQVSNQNNSVIIFDRKLQKSLLSRSCEVFRSNFTLPLMTSPMASIRIRHIRYFYRCHHVVNVTLPPTTSNYTCPPYHIYQDKGFPALADNFIFLSNCSMLQLPGNDWRVSSHKGGKDLFSHISANISIEVLLYENCYSCHYQSGGQCRLDRRGNFYCAKERSWNLNLGLGLGLGAGVLCILIIIGCLILRRYKWNYTPSLGQARNTSSDPYSNPDSESGCVYFGVPLFSYKVLQEATNNFDLARELGVGGFGTVYYGKLQDGREVAVKRLYEHNFRRVRLFMNEVEILTRLRHKNLVSLYGCTSCQSRELLLVYEYIPNGTVASHLHGNLAKCKLLPWALRMKIAIETASALVYLHASDIIHRDVKTNNILLDNSYCVKVADFGLSRLFPNDVTHVSTAPQGTPGYVDPEYHRCYQLTSKSDVYSFGVVLIELISSMPAVDLTRDRDEINLADLALKKIKKGAFNELVDPSLGFELDSMIKRMIDAVVELAFQCLQGDSESRPSMDKVLEVLKRIVSERNECEDEEELDVRGAENSHSNIHSQSPTSQDKDEDGLLKNMKLSSSPNVVTDKWEYGLTTQNNSI